MKRLLRYTIVLHHCETCELSAAAPLALQALALLEPLGKTALGTVTTVMLNLAGILEDHGHYCAAVRLCQLAVESANATPVRVVCLTQLANLSRLQGQYPQAEILYRQALAIAEAAAATDAYAVATALNGLGVVYKYQGRYDEAEPLYRRALQLTEQAVGSDHPDVASIYHNLGGLEHARGLSYGEPLAR
ncbi:MAG: tetratricopeptide repeat protein [Caldilineaceae bacterium]